MLARQTPPGSGPFMGVLVGSKRFHSPATLNDLKLSCVRKRNSVVQERVDNPPPSDVPPSMFAWYSGSPQWMRANDPIDTSSVMGYFILAPPPQLVAVAGNLK